MLIFLHPFIWSLDAILRWVQEKKGVKLYANLGKSAVETLAIKAFGEEGMRSRWKSPNSP
jgi:hypothetical protein